MVVHCLLTLFFIVNIVLELNVSSNLRMKEDSNFIISIEPYHNDFCLQLHMLVYLLVKPDSTVDCYVTCKRFLLLGIVFQANPVCLKYA